MACVAAVSLAFLVAVAFLFSGCVPPTVQVTVETAISAEGSGQRVYSVSLPVSELSSYGMSEAEVTSAFRAALPGAMQGSLQVRRVGDRVAWELRRSFGDLEELVRDARLLLGCEPGIEWSRRAVGPFDVEYSFKEATDPRLYFRWVVRGLAGEWPRGAEDLWLLQGSAFVRFPDGARVALDASGQARRVVSFGASGTPCIVWSPLTGLGRAFAVIEITAPEWEGMVGCGLDRDFREWLASHQGGVLVEERTCEGGGRVCVLGASAARGLPEDLARRLPLASEVRAVWVQEKTKPWLRAGRIEVTAVFPRLGAEVAWVPPRFGFGSFVRVVDLAPGEVQALADSVRVTGAARVVWPNPAFFAGMFVAATAAGSLAVVVVRRRGLAGKVRCGWRAVVVPCAVAAGLGILRVAEGVLAAPGVSALGWAGLLAGRGHGRRWLWPVAGLAGWCAGALLVEWWKFGPGLVGLPAEVVGAASAFALALGLGGRGRAEADSEVSVEPLPRVLRLLAGVAVLLFLMRGLAQEASWPLAVAGPVAVLAAWWGGRAGSRGLRAVLPELLLLAGSVICLCWGVVAGWSAVAGLWRGVGLSGHFLASVAGAPGWAFAASLRAGRKRRPDGGGGGP